MSNVSICFIQTTHSHYRRSIYPLMCSFISSMSAVNDGLSSGVKFQQDLIILYLHVVNAIIIYTYTYNLYYNWLAKYRLIIRYNDVSQEI